MQFGMVMGAFITYQLTTPEISPLGRMAGGLLVYVFSIVDANGIAKLRIKAWERIEAGQPPRPRKGMTREAAVEGSPRRRAQEGRALPLPGARTGPPGDLPQEPWEVGGTLRQDPMTPAEPEDESGTPGGPEVATGAKPAASERPSG